MKNIKIGFVGLTHLGLNYLAATVQKNYSVIGVDTNEKIIKRLNKNIIDHREPNLKKLITKNKKKILFTSQFKYLSTCQIIFISQDVSTDEKGQSDLKSLRKLIDKTITKISKKSIFVILSQMKPGFVRSINFPKSRLYYQVETLVFGNAINRALFPERVIIGCDNKLKKINPIYLKYLKKFSCPIIKMNFESAEVAKIAINLLLASSVTTSNILSELCEKVSADWQDVIPALRLDKRIGKFSYIKSGLGIAGGNIERDIVTAKNLLKKNEPPSLILNDILGNSDYMKNWVKRLLIKKKFLNEKKINIGVVGVTYKENTNSIKNSPALKLIGYLKNKSNISVYEPMVKLSFANKKIKQIKSLVQLIKNNKIIIFMRPWANNKEINSKYKIFNQRIIIDPYRVMNDKKTFKKDNYFTIGKG